MLKRNRRVKIVATLGPASAEPEMIERLFAAGVDVFRINMSHSRPPHDGVKKLHAAVRAAEAKFGRPIGILCDLQGPKFRVGEMTGGRQDLKAIAIGRLMLDNFPHVKSFWIMNSAPVTQTALWYGADDVDGTTPVPPATGRTVYRIVQEGITNVRKHAPGSVVAIRSTGDPRSGIRVVLANPLGAARAGAPGAARFSAV